MGRFLAIDFGEKRVGLALSDPTKIIAKPFKSIIYTDHDDLLNKYADKVEYCPCCKGHYDINEPIGELPGKILLKLLVILISSFCVYCF